MKDYLIIEENLIPDDINEIYYLIDQFGTWEDGNLTYNGGKDGSKKNNQIYFSDQFALQKLSDIVFNRIDTYRSFRDYTIATESRTPLISRTSVGGYYHPHHDKASNGDFSTTIFLNDDFEGGELCLWLNGGEERIKLPAGGSVTYKTGTPHMVREVTEGHRDVVIFWTHSRLRDPFEIELYRGLSQALRCLKFNHNTTLEEADKDPIFIIRALRNSLLRKSSR